MLKLADKWIWDSWPVHDGEDHHLFYLQASNAHGHPDLRHHNATIGHAVTQDYRTWKVLPDALAPAAGPAWDDLSVWTGSIVRGDAGSWHLFYSGVARADGASVQRIGRADSADLITWQRHDSPPIQADPRWYETVDSGNWREEAWRDPWVLRDPDGDGWHMLVTARARRGSRFSRGVIGHAHSSDLVEWQAKAPLTERAGFGHMEVPQVAQVDGRHVLVFCCMGVDADARRRAQSGAGGMWSAPAAGPLGPFDLSRCEPFPDPSLYAAHIVPLGDDGHGLLGFTNMLGTDFVGAIPPPTPVRLTSRGVLEPVRTDRRGPAR